MLRAVTRDSFTPRSSLRPTLDAVMVITKTHLALVPALLALSGAQQDPCPGVTEGENIPVDPCPGGDFFNGWEGRRRTQEEQHSMCFTICTREVGKRTLP